MGICDNYQKNKIEPLPQSLSQNNPNQQTYILSDFSNVNNYNRNLEKRNIKPEMRFIEQPLALNRNQFEKKLNQMGKGVCRIDLGKKTGIGFLCLIPFPNKDNLLKTLITCNHILNNIKIGNKIKVIFDKNIKKEIILDDKRKLFTNKKYDITIIELKDNEFDINNYLQIDDELYTNNKIKENDKIYIIHYPEGIEVKYSVGSIIYKKGNKIGYKCEKEEGSSGEPILNLYNFKVIGIHSGVEETKFNIGEILKLPINYFYQKITNIKKNMIINENLNKHVNANKNKNANENQIINENQNINKAQNINENISKGSINENQITNNLVTVDPITNKHIEIEKRPEPHIPAPQDIYYFHLKGLYNIGSTCYMNSVLQCLLHVSELIYYFLNEYPKDSNLLKEKIMIFQLMVIFLKHFMN